MYTQDGGTTLNNELKVRIDLKLPVPVYRQIVDGLRVLLVGGKLTPGTVLPPVRRLAIDLGVHFNTVAQAYRALADEGWLHLQHGRGATVIARKDPSASSSHQEARVRLRSLLAELRARGASPEKLGAALRALAEEMES